MEVFLLVACGLLFFLIIVMQSNTISKLQRKLDEDVVFPELPPVYIGLDTPKKAKKPAKKATKKPVRKTTKRS